MLVESSIIDFSVKHLSFSKERTASITLRRPILSTFHVPESKELDKNIKDSQEKPLIEEEKLTEKKRIAKYIVEYLFGKLIYPTKDKQETSKLVETGAESESYEITNIESKDKEEIEDLQISIEGSVSNLERKGISFHIGIDMHRYLYESSISVSRSAEAKDPIIIMSSPSFDTIFDKRIEFDIDGDGYTDRIPFPARGNGFLIIDENDDGKVTDGIEILGAKTGNALSELISLDNDGNGWIDENDKAFEKLGVWEKTEAGEDIVRFLREKGIGAISLATIQTPFHLMRGAECYGRLIETGIVAYENGYVSTFHRVELFL